MNGLCKFLVIVMFFQTIFLVYTVTEHREYLIHQYHDEYLVGRGQTIATSQEAWVSFNLFMPLSIQLFLMIGSTYALQRSTVKETQE